MKGAIDRVKDGEKASEILREYDTKQRGLTHAEQWHWVNSKTRRKLVRLAAKESK